MRPVALLAAALALACAVPPARPPTEAAAQAAAAPAPGPGEGAPLTRALEAYVGRQILVGAAGAPAEPWILRGIAEDHLTLERSRTYRVVPLRRVAEITWTDLTGIDPAPRVVLE
jgi:hypothetical protein